MYIVQMYIHISKRGIHISLYIYGKPQCFKEVYDFMLGRTHCSAGSHAVRGLDSPDLFDLARSQSIRYNLIKAGQTSP